MLNKPHSERRGSVRPQSRHAYPIQTIRNSGLLERMRACVSKDRLEALGKPDAESLLSVVNEESHVIRDSLGVCQRIADLVN
jgi:hypothetical protein